jgi:hypothetical protein
MEGKMERGRTEIERQMERPGNVLRYRQADGERGTEAEKEM